MNKVENLLELLDDYKKILKLTKSNIDINVLSNFIKQLKPFKDLELDTIYERINVINAMNVEKVKMPKAEKLNLDIIAGIYTRIRNNITLNQDELTAVEEFEKKHPNFRDLVLEEIGNLYTVLSRDSEKKLSIKELELLLRIHFGFVDGSKKTKQDLIGILQKNIYQSNYFDKVKSNYEEKKGNGI